MLSTEGATRLKRDSVGRTAHCVNRANCTTGETGKAVEWYLGAGEYCPECGEALVPGDPAAAPSSSNGNGAAVAAPAAAVSAPAPAAERAAMKSAPAPGPAASAPVPASAPIPAPAPRQTASRLAASAARAKFIIPLRWFWIVAAALGASAAIVYAARPDVGRQRAQADSITVCTISSAPQLAADLVRGYAAKSATRANRFSFTTAKTCDVRFSMTPETPDDVIAHDAIVAVVNPQNPIARISETELRLIFSGSIHDWSELGLPPGPIVAMLPAAGTDEAKALESSLFFGVTIDRAVRRGRSSAAVAREVTSGDSDSRNAIGLVAFSQAAAAKVVPLTYLPVPNVLSIASGRYPYTLSIAVRAASTHDNAATSGLLSYARSSDGAAIVVKNGLVPRKRD